jgi:hypothetical protein
VHAAAFGISRRGRFFLCADCPSSLERSVVRTLGGMVALQGSLLCLVVLALHAVRQAHHQKTEVFEELVGCTQ